MPHIVIEYTPNLGDLPFDAMLAATTQALSESPEVQDEADLKARVLRAEHFRVGLQDSGRGYLHVQLRILAGRTPEAKTDLSRRVADALRSHLNALPSGLEAYLSVEVVDMDRGSYTKVRLA
ncbi:5-carboxymethyl-2-hydroxymuconate Delta-isomerase [Pseudorhodoferax sp. Leaf274]|uniref:5-carboxymethyl-2-hydroxymuconate Delta-isomerase n=1 Tax=Pseudorhodoferax sp. Leaf274 TaxID=1736318 RepID=UPI0007032746|nr:5-carboxymethyl-2-hydroxymuconate Delta-isomerase [Pseudorhodoferax sp. Leaf274]KQP44558.1 5-carboxymethyl-2-hydroxymuconate isomerase [Pseudorhodoferax sp. Leaf274]